MDEMKSALLCEGSGQEVSNGCILWWKLYTLRKLSTKKKKIVIFILSDFSRTRQN